MCLVEIMVVKPGVKNGLEPTSKASKHRSVGEEVSKTLKTWGNGRGKREERRYLQTAGGTEEFPVANHTKVNSGHHYSR